MERKLQKLQMAEFKEAFNEFDKDGSGAISTKELLAVMRSLGQNPTEDEVHDLRMEFDMDNSGKIELEEFLEMMKTKSSMVDHMDDIREAFKIFDKNGDGFIDAKEFGEVMMMMGSTLSKEEVAAFMAATDVDGSGQLDYDEFVKRMME